MKKFFALLLALTMVLTIVACGEAQNSAADDSDVQQSSDDANNQQSDADQQQSDPADAATDDRGIPGMKASTIKFLLQSSFGVPVADDIEDDQANNPYCASHCTSSGSSDDGVVYDYSISMDDDGEIVGASFGVTATTDSATGLKQAADLYFYAISISDYDTADKDTLSAWFEENVPTVTSSGVSITVGDAKFEMYGIEGSTYWVDVSKVA